MMSIMLTTSVNDSCTLTPSRSVGTQRMVNISAASDTPTVASASTTVTNHLPNTSAVRSVGVTSNGSNEPRSRSPAVTSVAVYMPPMKAAISTNMATPLRNNDPRARGVDTSTRVIASGRLMPGLMPCANSRSAPTWALCCCSTCSILFTGANVALRDAS